LATLEAANTSDPEKTMIDALIDFMHRILAAGTGRKKNAAVPESQGVREGLGVVLRRRAREFLD
jgi:hypothetical protein